MEIEKILKRYVLSLLVHLPIVAMYFGFGLFEVLESAARFSSLFVVNLSLWTVSFLAALLVRGADINLLFDEHWKTVLGACALCSMIILISWIFVPSSLAIYDVNMISCPIAGLISFGFGCLVLSD